MNVLDEVRQRVRRVDDRQPHPDKHHAPIVEQVLGPDIPAADNMEVEAIDHAQAALPQCQLTRDFGRQIQPAGLRREQDTADAQLAADRQVHQLACRRGRSSSCR